MPSKCSLLIFMELDHKTKRRLLNVINHYVAPPKKKKVLLGHSN